MPHICLYVATVTCSLVLYALEKRLGYPGAQPGWGINKTDADSRDLQKLKDPKVQNISHKEQLLFQDLSSYKRLLGLGT